MTLDNAPKWALTAAILAGASVALYVIVRGFRGAAADAAGAVVDVATGAIEGIGESVGIPKTDLEKCYDAMQREDNTDASFFCPAPIFLEWQLKSAKKRAADTFGGILN